MEVRCEHCGNLWQTTMGDTGCHNPNCPEKLHKTMEDQEAEIQSLKAEIERLRDEAAGLIECCFDTDAKLELTKSRAAAWKQCALAWKDDSDDPG